MKANRSSAMVSLNTLQTTVSLNIYKNSANKFGRKTGFKIENDQDQSIPKLKGILTELRCIFGQNLEILTSIGGEWSCGQAQNSVNFDFEVKFDLEGQDQSTPKIIGILTKMFCMSGSNFVILVGTSNKLSRRQARDWRPHEQTQATTIPEGQNWPRVKIPGNARVNITWSTIIHVRVTASIISRNGNKVNITMCHILMATTVLFQYVKAKTKWLSFCRHWFQVNF